MQDFLEHANRVSLRVELVQFNLHRSHGLVIGGLRQDPNGMWELPGRWVQGEEEPVDTARRVIKEIFRLHSLLHDPVFVGFRRVTNPEPAVSAVFTNFGLVPNTVIDWSKFAIVGPQLEWTASTFHAGRLVEQARKIIIEVAAEFPVLARALAAQRKFDFFTVRELQETYETVLGYQVDPANFRRKVMAPEFLELVAQEDLVALALTSVTTEGKAPLRYRCGNIERLDPPIRFNV